MLTENDFNARLSAGLKKFRPDVFAVKQSDKYKVGLSDFMIFKGGRAVAVEAKFIKEFPSDGAALLKHPFSSPQMTFMKCLSLTGARAFGLIGVKQTGEMIIVPSAAIPETGNWKTKVFREAMRREFRVLAISDVEELIIEIFPWGQ